MPENKCTHFKNQFANANVLASAVRKFNAARTKVKTTDLKKLSLQL